MTITIDTSDYDPTKSGAFESPSPGRAHVLVTDWEEYAVSGRQGASHRMTLEILAHDNEEDVGKIHREIFSSLPSANWKLRAAVLALGLVTTQQLEQAKKEGKSIEVDMSQAVGRTMYVRFAKHMYNDQEFIRVDGRMYSLDDPRCQGWPTCDAMVKRGQADQQTEPDEAKQADPFGF